MRTVSKAGAAGAPPLQLPVATRPSGYQSPRGDLPTTQEVTPDTTVPPYKGLISHTLHLSNYLFTGASQGAGVKQLDRLT